MSILQILEEVGFDPRPQAAASVALESLAQGRGIAIPRAFAELWSLEGIADFLLAQTNSDRAIVPSELAGFSQRRWLRHDAIAVGYLPFMIENQGVCTWAIKLGTGDDPEVHVEVDSGDPPRWDLNAASLSQWLECLVEDGRTQAGSWWMAQAKELTSADESELRRQFVQGPTTYAWPGVCNLRFSNPCGRLLLWVTSGHTDWFVAPANGREVELLREILPLSDLHRSLYESQIAVPNVLASQRYRTGRSTQR